MTALRKEKTEGPATVRGGTEASEGSFSKGRSKDGKDRSADGADKRF